MWPMQDDQVVDAMATSYITLANNFKSVQHAEVTVTLTLLAIKICLAGSNFETIQHIILKLTL